MLFVESQLGASATGGTASGKMRLLRALGCSSATRLRGSGPAEPVAKDHRHGLNPAVGPAQLERASEYWPGADNRQACPQQAGARVDPERDTLQRSIKGVLGIISDIFFS